MKLLTPFVIVTLSLFSFSCNRDEPSAYQKLKAETGASDQELEAGIKFYREFYVLMRDEIEAGTFKPHDLLKSSKGFGEFYDKTMASMEREDEMTAVMTLVYLRALERDGSDKARELMAKQLASFLEAEFPSTEESQNIRKQILEYSKTSRSLTELNKANRVPGSD